MEVIFRTPPETLSHVLTHSGCIFTLDIFFTDTKSVRSRMLCPGNFIMS